MQRVIREAIKAYGADMQQNVAIEEMSELIKELCKNKRGEENSIKIAEEIADIEIMLEQLKVIYELHEQVNDFKARKIYRLANRLELDGTVNL